MFKTFNISISHNQIQIDELHSEDIFMILSDQWKNSTCILEFPGHIYNWQLSVSGEFQNTRAI
jgi:hypothetical protein